MAEQLIPGDILNFPRGVSPGAYRIALERERQVSAEGWTAEHDAEHGDQTLVWAARAYACVYNLPASMATTDGTADGVGWPWDIEFWKPTDSPIRNLEKAGALIAAALDVLLAAEGHTVEIDHG